MATHNLTLFPVTSYYSIAKNIACTEDCGQRRKVSFSTENPKIIAQCNFFHTCYRHCENLGNSDVWKTYVSSYDITFGTRVQCFLPLYTSSFVVVRWMTPMFQVRFKKKALKYLYSKSAPPPTLKLLNNVNAYLWITDPYKGNNPMSWPSYC